MLLPFGYAVFEGSSPLADGQVMKTSESFDIRHKETGELLVSVPAPLVYESDMSALPGIGQYFIMQTGEHVQLTTTIDSEWLMDENRSYPIMIDPSIDVTAATTWYTYYYRYVTQWGSSTYEYAFTTSFITYTCKGSGGNGASTCTSSSYYSNYLRTAVHRFNLANTMPTGATVTGVDFENHVGRYRTGARNFVVSVMKSGSSQSSTMVDPSQYTANNGRMIHRYAANSAASSATTTISDPGYYYGRTAGSIKSITMNSNGESDVQDAVDGNGGGTSGNILGLAVRNVGNAPMWYWCTQNTYVYYGCQAGSQYKPHLEISYTGGSDTAAPIAAHAAFDGKTTYLEGSRTMYISMVDASGINTTAAGAPHLYYRVDGGSWTGVSATTLGTCVAGQTCNFKATIPGQTAPATGTTDVEYYWAYRDSPAPPNGGVSGTTGTTPAGGTGIPSNMVAPSSPYMYSIESVDNAADGDSKWQVRGQEWNSYSYYSAQRYYDWQMTYYEPSREYHWEYDTSSCGTGSQSCFNMNAVFDLRYYPSTWRVCTSTACQSGLEKVTMPGLSMHAKNGPGSDVIWYHDGTQWGAMQYDIASGNVIDSPQSAGTEFTSLDYGSTDDGYVKISIPDDITGYFGSFTWNSTYNLNSANRNLFCVNTNMNPIMFVRSTYTGSAYSNPCYATYYYWQYDYAWNGWAAPGYDGKVNNGWQINSKVSSIKPQPDTFPPEFDHPGMMDTYVTDDRTLSFVISDAGDPPVGLNTNATDAGDGLVGPEMDYRVYDAEAGSWSAWTTRSMTPDAARASCVMNACTWTTSIPGVDRGNSVEYSLRSVDNNGNWNNTTAYSYAIATPTKVFVIEWHDHTAGFNSGYNVNYQVRLYDVTNEVEFAYDTGSNVYYDYQYIGFQNPAANIGTMLRGQGAGFIGGQNPFTTNYRIATDGSSYGVEEYSVGMNELFNYNEEFTGSGNGQPYTFYCSYYFTQYRNDCSTVIDLPNDFEFEYFGTTFNGTQGHKIHAIRHGAMQFSTSSSSNSAQLMGNWGTVMPTLPNSGTYVRNVDLAPFWGYYASYYCYYNSASECSIRSKLIPFDGAGMDVTQDITTPTIWDIEQSPIRVNPANGDWLQVSADLTIMPGVEVQIAEGKGMVMTGSCNKLTATGNATHPITISNMGTNYAQGLAFTNGGCSSATTDDRHTFEHVNFVNLTTAISAGSRNGASPHYNGNVGNFTISDSTFTNVGTAIKHGSGQGTGFDLSGVDISNSADSCVDLPDDSSLTWIGGSASECNTHAYAGQGAVSTGDGSTVWIENVDFTDAAVNGIIGTADSLSLSNVTVDASSGFSWQQTGTGVAQTGTATSGTDAYFYNVDISNYHAALTTHATDSLHIEDVDSSGDSNGYTVTPAGASSPAIGATGWTMDGLSADGGLTMARTQPANMDNVDLGGTLQLSGTAPSTSRVSGDSVDAEGITINGCGWNVDFSDVSIGSGGSNGAWVSANCASASSTNVVTVSDGTMSGSSSNNNYAYARNSVLTVAEMTITGMTAMGSYVASAGTNGDIRLIDVNFDGNDCLDSNNEADTSVCWVEAASSSAKIYFGGTGTVMVYRSGSSGNVFKAQHNVAASVHDSGGTELFQVGSSRTDSSGAASTWLITDLYEMDNNGNTASSASYTDHTIRVAGSAGQNTTGPADPWYTSDNHPTEYPGASNFPLEVGGTVYMSLEAFPMDFGQTADCSFFSTNNSASLLGGYYTYSRQIITLSADMVLDGCNVHLSGTSLRMNVSAGNNPTITLRNGAELLISEEDGDYGHIKSQSSTYPWSMDLSNGGQLTLDAGSIRDMDGGLLVSDGGTLEMRNGSTAYGSPNAAASTATIHVDGGTYIVNNAQVQNVNSGVGVHLEATAASSLSNIIVKNAAVGIEVVDAAPTIDGFDLQDNTVGLIVDGGMSLPTLYRSTILSGHSAGWSTNAVDITSFAKANNFVQIGTNIVYGGGNSDPVYGSYYAKYFMTTDRWRIAVDSGDGNGLTNVTDSSVTGYYPYSAADPASGTGGVATYESGARGGAPIWDCNLYGYRYNVGGSYQYAYYYYFIAYGGGAYTMNGNYNNEPNEFGFRLEVADGVTANTNYYPYHYWGSYWPSFYYSGQYAPPEGFNGMWGSYNVCQNYAYGAGTPIPAGYRLAYPIVDTSSPNIQQVVMYVDMVHYGADYYNDRLEVSVRAGNSVTELLGKEYSRDFGTADISDGTITGADTGIDIGGARAAGALSDITITNPVNEGVLISGSTSATMDSITVDGGKYGVRMGSAAGGKLVLTNVDLDGQSLDGLVLSTAMNLPVSGTIQNAGYCGLKVLSSSDADWSFDGLTLNGNGVGVTHDGTGLVTMTGTTMSGNTDDVTMSGSARMDYLEGDITESKVITNDQSLFTRLRALDVSVSADGSGVDAAPVKILDADNRVVSSGTTDSNGDLAGITFVVWEKDSSGVTTANLAGYQMVTIATIDYTSGSLIDSRYAMNSITLTDAPGNSAAAALTSYIDARTCYGFVSASYDVQAHCTGMAYNSNRTVSNGDGGTIEEFGYYMGTSSTWQDLSNMVIQMDSPFNYADVGTGSISFNGSTIFTTGCYNSETRLYPIYPYQGHVWMHDTTMIAMCDESGGNGASFRLGYSGTYSYGNYHIDNATMLGLKSIATGSGYYQSDGDLHVTNSLLMHHVSSTNIANGGSSVYYDDMCIQTSGYDDVVIEGNTFIDCGVGVFIPNNFYAISPAYTPSSQIGTQRMSVSNNDMQDCSNLCMWFYLGAHSTDNQVNGNTMSTLSGYAIYTQDTNVFDLEIDGNTIFSENPIYTRGAREVHITNNDITGVRSASNACIFTLNAWGDISDNTCTDADGGIAVSGIRSGNDMHIEGNHIGFTAGRLPTSAIGIYVENCGLDEVFMADNVVTTVMNAVMTDGCRVTDNNSAYQGLGGGAGRIHNVDIYQSTYTPSHLEACTGDSVRWVSRAYGSTNTPHTTTSDPGQAESWDSGTMNLGSSFVHQFTNVGNFSYYSSTATSMTGTVNVADCSGNNLQTTGIDILGGGDQITLNGVMISGYGLGLAQTGGSLSMNAGTTIFGDATAVEVTDVDVTTLGANLVANATYGVGLNAVSQNGRDTLELTSLSTNAAVGVIADGHEDFRWNGGLAQGHTVLKTVNGASGTLESMYGIYNHPTFGEVPVAWEDTYSCYSVDPGYIAGNSGSCGGVTTQINAGPYSTVTSIGNGVLNNGSMISPWMPSKLTVDADAIVHEGNLLDLTVLHMGSPATDVGLYIRSLAMATNLNTGESVAVPGGRAEYVSPSWRSSPGRTITVDGILWDWLGSNMLNEADDMMPGAVAVNATTQAHMRVTWDSNYMFIALVGPTFVSTDGLFYLDTAPGGSSTGDNWHSQHTLPIKADYMLWMEDLNNWGLRKVMPTGNWVDVTSSCPQITSSIFMGNPFTTTPVSEFRVPWSCLGSPTEEVRWIAMVQWDSPFGQDGQVAGVFPEQPYDGSTTSGQTFGVFGNFNLVGADLADGTLDDHLLLFRTYTGSSTSPGDPHAYQILVKVRNAEGDYWDWDDSVAPLVMTTNQDITIDIMRAKPIIENLVDVSYDEDSGSHTITLTDKASDYQDASSGLMWTVTDAASNTHSYPTPYDYTLTGQSLGLDTLENQFGGHRLQLTVTDSHGLSATQTMEVGIWNVNDAPVICNTNRFDCMPVFYDDGDGNLNVHDENFNGLITKELGDTSNATRSYVVDMANEQTQSDWNNEAIPQVYTWTEDEGSCTPFASAINSNVLTIAENTANEAGGNCDIVLDLSDGASTNSDASSVTVNFIVNPVNDQPVIMDFNAQNGVYVETANSSLQLDWFWDVMEDDEDASNLTWDLSRLMSDNDHPVEQLSWSVEETSLCAYENYFSITVDNDADTLEIDLIDDAATDAPTSEIDFLQDADNDGVADGGVHQMQPASGVYCTVYLWLNDTADAPSHIDYAQSPSGVYEQRSIRETVYIRVINTQEARPDYNFGDSPGYNWLNIEAVLPGTRVPVDIDITNTGDDPTLYNYGHDVQVRFYVDDNPTLIQDQVTLSWDAGEVPGVGETVTIRGHVTLNNPSEYVRTFLEVRTINPHTDEYIDNSIRRPALEELNWDNNNVTTDDTADGLPQMVRLRPATSVASFAPGLIAVSLVGAFVGALLMGSRREEDEEELMESLSTDDEAVSPVIATILLVAITVVLSGVIYVWAQSLASDSTGKATPRLTFDSSAMFEHTGDQTLWNWKINVVSHDNELAAQAVYVIVIWTDDDGVAHNERVNMADPDGVYGFIPSNSPSLVTYKDSINCNVDCSAGFGANDIIHIRMVDPASGDPIEDAQVTLQYAPAGGTAVILMTFTAQYNPPSLKATY
jgi:flagellin-like protein